MDHIRSLNGLSLEGAYLSVGTFDGVHRGHAALLAPMIASAHSAGAPAVALTFHPHPAMVLGRRSIPFCLTTAVERANLLAQEGIDLVVTEPFTRELASVSAEDFTLRLKKHLGLKSLWIGHDFALGKGREGNEVFLRKMGSQLDFEVCTVEVFQNAGVVSSTRIRQLLRAGDVLLAASLLGRPYSLAGEVVPGDQRGRTIGIPTANLDVDPGKLIPAAGVYACEAVTADQRFPAAVNIGVRPTFEGQDPIQHVEAHLLDYSGDLYGKEVRLHFIERLRDEKRFNSIGELVDQIQLDIKRSREVYPIR